MVELDLPRAYLFSDNEWPGDSFSKQKVDIDIPVIDVTSKMDIGSEELLDSQHNGKLLRKLIIGQTS